MGGSRQRGQSIVEIAIATPVLLGLVLGAFTTTVMLSDRVIAGYACRQGARLAAELGGSQTNPTLTTAQIDSNIVKNVVAVAQAMNFSTLTEVDIYKPARADGVYTPGDPVDAYSPSGILVGTAGFPITQRVQIPPGETSIGVRLVWQYKPPTAFASINIQMNEYAVMKAAPVLL